MRSLIWLVGFAAAACRFTPPPGDNPNADAPRIDAPTDPDAPDGATVAWLDPWTHRKSITLLAAQIEAPNAGTLDDFPVLISVNDPEINAVALASGADIVFTASDATTQLAGEIESFTGGQLVAWVKVPHLSATTDTLLYVYYGNAAPQAGTPEAVWSASFEGVWHLQQTPGGANDILDATPGNHDGTTTSMTAADAVTAQIGRGLHFNGSSAFVNFNTMDVGNTFTLSMWANLQGGSGIKTLMSNSVSGPGKNGFRWFVDTDNTSDRKLLFETGDGTNNSIALTGGNVIVQGVWAYVAVTVDRAAADAQLYVNGVNKTANNSMQNDFLTNSDFEVGRMEDIFRWIGILDEVEIAATIRPVEWIQTSYNNQNNPAGFSMFGTEEQR